MTTDHPSPSASPPAERSILFRPEAASPFLPLTFQGSGCCRTTLTPVTPLITFPPPPRVKTRQATRPSPPLIAMATRVSNADVRETMVETPFLFSPWSLEGGSWRLRSFAHGATANLGKASARSFFPLKPEAGKPAYLLRRAKRGGSAPSSPPFLNAAVELFSRQIALFVRRNRSSYSFSFSSLLRPCMPSSSLMPFSGERKNPSQVRCSLASFSLSSFPGTRSGGAESSGFAQKIKSPIFQGKVPSFPFSPYARGRAPFVIWRCNLPRPENLAPFPCSFFFFKRAGRVNPHKRGSEKESLGPSFLHDGFANCRRSQKCLPGNNRITDRIELMRQSPLSFFQRNSVHLPPR